MHLLERTTPLSLLSSTFQQTWNGQGSVVLVSGEAGIGKTAFVSTFTSEQRPPVEVLWGACDPFFTPRPLGPLYEIAVRGLPGLLDLLHSGADWLAAAALLYKTLLERSAPAVLVFEDIHWADEATLDLIRYLGRRAQQMKVLLVLTYREEAAAGGPLRSVLGDLTGPGTVRVRLEPLSEAAVEALAQALKRPARGVYAATRGNPFFVTEVLREGGADLPPEGRIPETVRDAVLARAAHLPAPARELLDAVSIFPGQVELGLLEEVCPASPAARDACTAGGFLLPAGEGLVFRHELARLAIEEALPPGRARELHQKALAALGRRPAAQAALARLVHHAIRAGDAGRVLEAGPRAAEQASRQGAHREAARYYETALRFRGQMSDADLAGLLDRLSFEYYVTGQIARAIETRREALALWERLGQMEPVGDGQRWLSRLYWFDGSKELADHYDGLAVETLEQLQPGKALAMAYSNRSQLHMLAEEKEPAVEWGRKALALAEALGEDEITVHALTNIGTAELIDGSEQGRLRLEQALRLALEHGMHDHASRCYANLTSRLIENRRYGAAEPYLLAGLAYTADRDLSTYSVYLLGMQARFLFEQGRWDEALAACDEAHRLQPGSSVIALPGITTRGHLLARQGDPEAGRWLDEARALALPNREFQRIGPVSAARAEAAWWSGQPGQVLAELEPALELAAPGKEPYLLGAIAFWTWRAGGQPRWPDEIPLAYRALIAGDWRAAAAEWARIGCPFEQALALAEGDPPAQRLALETFEKLGARPAARLLREKLAAQGVKGLPRGARPATRANPAGLTARELEILALLAEGLGNAQIAGRLSISQKTVDHHVSAVLAKLGVRSRGEAAAVARGKGIV